MPHISWPRQNDAGTLFWESSQVSRGSVGGSAVITELTGKSRSVATVTRSAVDHVLNFFTSSFSCSACGHCQGRGGGLLDQYSIPLFPAAIHGSRTAVLVQQLQDVL